MTSLKVQLGNSLWHHLFTVLDDAQHAKFSEELEGDLWEQLYSQPYVVNTRCGNPNVNQKGWK